MAEVKAKQQDFSGEHSKSQKKQESNKQQAKSDNKAGTWQQQIVDETATWQS